VEEARRAEARAIARRLRSLLEPACTERPIVDRQAGEPRPVRLGDVAMLFRALSDVHLYEEALREYELPYYLVGGHAFYAQQEVYDVLNLLRAVASTADELSLAGVLRSPFFALADESLFWLVEAGQSLNAGLMAERLPPQLSPEERAKVAAAAATIHALREMKDSVPIAALLGEALKRTAYDAVLLAEFLGERKLANLHKLLERARAADRGVTDLDGFITQLAQFISQQPKEALAATLPENADVIRLMTIHHAKGLEFPLVIVPDLDRPLRVPAPCAALHRDLGPLVPLPSEDDRQCATGMSIFASLEQVEELEERKRLLYVAATRAADYLIFSSSLEDFDKLKSDWMKLVAERYDLQSGAFRGGLPADYEPPQVCVVTDPQTDHRPVGRTRGPDLLRMLEEAHQLADEGGGAIPAETVEVPPDLAARRRFTVSQLTGKLEPADVLRSPLAGDDGEPAALPGKARGLGTLVHDVLSRIDWRVEYDLAGWCEHLAGQHVPAKPDDVARQARELLERFCATPRAQKLAQAKTLNREVEFLLAWPPGEPNSDGRFLHGYIDCLYQDTRGDWHLIDYKTDNLSADEVAREAKQYEMQIGLYALAAERALGVAPVEVVLYFLKPGVERCVAWNDAARRATTDQINQAIAATTLSRSR
jgi:ATP-dependent helicase/nuclease subunit A